MSARRRVIVCNTTPDDFAGIMVLTEETYPGTAPRNTAQLTSLLHVFPEGQVVDIAHFGSGG